MNTAYRLVCTGCARVADYSAFRCSACGHILDVAYDYKSLKLPAGFGSARAGHRKYLQFFPIDRFRIHSREGGTPLVDRRIGGARVLLKLETYNPTRSFKDRGSVIEINKALELGAHSICCASTGNMGLSVAHYAHIAGLRCTIFISRDANRHKISLIKKAGARLVRVKGDFNAALRAAETYAGKTGAFVCGDYHYRKEGQKSVIFELVEQMRYSVPDIIFVPVGNATLIAAMHKGLSEFRRFSLIRKFPRIVAVQSEMCDPLVRAYNSKRDVRYMRPRTVADAIAVGYPTFGFEGLRALRATRGMAVSVSEQEILDAVSELRSIGIGAETGGAAAFAGFVRLRKKNPALLEGSKAVVLITGNNEPRT